ncbi:MAG: hypothetical protein II828_00030, partial [Clostridia bacterium]|nr:hypothetical protein [Clostridia bacterium]
SVDEYHDQVNDRTDHHHKCEQLCVCHHRASPPISGDFGGKKKYFLRNFRLRFSGFLPKIGAPPLSSILFANRENTLSVLSIVAYAVLFVKVFS